MEKASNISIIRSSRWLNSSVWEDIEVLVTTILQFFCGYQHTTF